MCTVEINHQSYVQISQFLNSFVTTMELFCLQETWLLTQKNSAQNLCWGRFDNLLIILPFPLRAPGQVQLYLSLHFIPFHFCIIIWQLLHVRFCLHWMTGTPSYSLKCLNIWDLSSNLPTRSIQSVSSSCWWGQLIMQKLSTILKSHNCLYRSSIVQQLWVLPSVTQWVSADHSMRKSRCTL